MVSSSRRPSANAPVRQAAGWPALHSDERRSACGSRVLVAATSALALAYGCEGAAPQTIVHCTPGESRPCACSNGQPGSQRCGGKGRMILECTCSLVASDTLGDRIDRSEATHSDAGTTAPLAGLGCTCTSASECASNNCGQFQRICMTGDLVDCQRSSDCACGSRCFVTAGSAIGLPDLAECDLPCAKDADCNPHQRCRASITGKLYKDVDGYIFGKICAWDGT